jgi:hypothetical protein
MLAPRQLNDLDEQILNYLRDEGRASPTLVRRATGDDGSPSRQYFSARLRRLAEHGIVRDLHGTGIYELVDDPRAGAGSDTTDADGRADAATNGEKPAGAPDVPDAAAAVIDDWTPESGADVGRARDAARRAVAWLVESGERATRSDIIDAVGADVSYGDRTAWERAIRPALNELKDRNLVEYRAGYHDYRWTGDGGGD